MKNLWINKKAIISILLAGSITLGTCGCARVVDTKENDDTSLETTVSDTQYMDGQNQITDLTFLNNSAYRPIEGDNKYTVIAGARAYYKTDSTYADEFVIDRNYMITALETNGEYVLATLPNGKEAYISCQSLIKCVNLNNANYVSIESNDSTSLSCAAYLYDVSGSYIGYLNEGQTCYTMVTNGEYTLIMLPDGTRGYVTNRSLMSNYQRIDGYGFLRKDVPVYTDSTFTNLAFNNSDDQMIQVVFINGDYAGIFTDNCQDLLYVRTANLDDDFILVDLDVQRMNCYLDYQLAGSWGTRSGKDSTPTHAGAFDIDEKVVNWEFTNYPGSHAKYWIPINEYEEGIHDLVGDDEQNYGNQAYHAYGSHGCIRVPSEASQFVYNNYEVGDMVLVRKK